MVKPLLELGYLINLNSDNQMIITKLNFHHQHPILCIIPILL